ncbi:MAG: hypothetical protein KGI79_02795 [Patescibacteria group bacterium]|nr:hypothetical protein [Patescibacteria group bacterium]MDE2116778.1 hypothetical protein [Patescibacteria group bacterium]
MRTFLLNVAPGILGGIAALVFFGLMSLRGICWALSDAFDRLRQDSFERAWKDYVPCPRCGRRVKPIREAPIGEHLDCPLCGCHAFRLRTYDRSIIPFGRRRPSPWADRYSKEKITEIPRIPLESAP